jgi:hypothetical protein
VEDLVTGVIFKDITVFPSTESSTESTSIFMPDRGASCLCCHLADHGGFSKVAVVSFTLGATTEATTGVATRSFDGVSGYSKRNRALYRKAYPGDYTRWSPQGYTEKIDKGWDKQSFDLSRDLLDPFKRARWNISGQFINKNDFQISHEGQVSRPGSPLVFPVQLPDGTTENILHLAQVNNPKQDPRERYFSGVKDLIPFTESTRKVMEFSLDHPLPKEILEDEEFLDTLLGITLPETKWWERTSVKELGRCKYDDQGFMIDQTWDHPEDSQTQAIGPSKEEGSTPRRRGWIIESSEGTLVGSNKFDPSNYGKVLKPTIFPYKPLGRFETSTESGYVPIEGSEDGSEARLAAGLFSWRAPYEYNTTRFEVTKEGMLNFEIGSTIPKEKIKWDGGKYEHPHGAGRSIEGHTTGSVKLVLGKNRDEEESLDLTTLGSTVLRLGADDCSLPNSRRHTLTQIRGKKDLITDRDIQWWDLAHRKLTTLGDVKNLENKNAGENVSLRSAMDGGMFLRLGARSEQSKRRHFYNGYKDGPGKERWDSNDVSRKDSKTGGRKTYGDTDSKYRFHDMSKVGSPKLGLSPFVSGSGDPTNGKVDCMGLSADIHAVRDLFLRVGQHEASGQSVTMDLAGALLAAFGKDAKGKSITAQLDGGLELTVGKAANGKSLRIELDGDVEIVINGHLLTHVTGDIVTESNHTLQMAKLAHITKSIKVMHKALSGIIDESTVFVKNQGSYTSGE